MKKILSTLLVLVLVVATFAACGKKEDTPTTTPDNTQNETTKEPTQENGLKDGTYFAQGEFAEKSGWKTVVTVEVKDGKIVNVDWNGANKNGGTDKKTTSKSGNYKMVEFGKAQAEWDVQAEATEKYLLEKQDTKALADDIAGVSIDKSEFITLVDQALANGPVEPGKWKDGAYHAEETEFVKGWKYTGDFTVIYGNIVAARWNGIAEDGGDDKITQSSDGRYGMVAKGKASSEWHEQAVLAEAHLLKTQDPTAVNYKDDAGHTDDIAGVTIHVIEFYKLAEQALQAR